MMNYTGTRCPVCNKKFLEKDDIVVCPICGAPHHRHCYDEAGECAFEEEHISGKAWKPVKDTVENESRIPDPASAQGDFCINPEDGSYWDSGGVEGKTCGYCGSKNPKDNLYCCSCGNRMISTGTAPPPGVPPMFGNFSNFDPVAAVYGGVLPTEKIGEHTAQEVATFVSRSSNHFLPRFKVLSMNKDKFRMDFNFPAFIFGFLYFFYRKMYKVGLVLLAISITLMVPNIIYTKNNLPQAVVLAYGQETLENEGLDVEEYLASVDTTGTENQQRVLQTVRILSMMFRMLMGIFANYLYYRFTQKQISKVKKQREDTGQPMVGVAGFDTALYRAGGISWKGIAIFTAVAFVLMFGFGNYVLKHIGASIEQFPYTF